MESTFYGNVVSYCKDRLFFHLGYRYDGNGQAKVAMCSKAYPWMKALFAQCGGLVPPWLKRHGSTNPYLGSTKSGRGHWNIESFNWKENLLLCFKWKGLEFSTPPTNNTEDLINPQITTFEPFNWFYCFKDWIQPKNRIWTRSGQLFFYEVNIPFNVVWHPKVNKGWKTKEQGRKTQMVGMEGEKQKRVFH